jgi:hypothetical protein
VRRKGTVTEIRGGWPDRIVDGVAIEDKRGLDTLRSNQVLVHEWLFQSTGRYPVIEYTESDGTILKFNNYKEFLSWRRVRFSILAPSETVRTVPYVKFRYPETQWLGEQSPSTK